MNKIAFGALAALVLVLGYLAFFSDGAKLRRLEQKIENDSLFMSSITQELDQINNTLDQVALLDQELRQSPDMDKADALAKVQRITELLDQRQMTINQLSLRVEQLEFEQNKQLAGGMFHEANQQLATADEYYRDLENSIRSLEGEVVHLKDIIAQQDQQLVRKDEVIAQIERERAEQQAKLAELDSLVARTQAKVQLMEQEYEASKIETASNYFALASEVLEMAERTNGVVNRDKKRTMVRMARDFFVKAKDMGHAQAQERLDFLLREREFSNLLQD